MLTCILEKKVVCANGKESSSVILNMCLIITELKWIKKPALAGKENGFHVFET